MWDFTAITAQQGTVLSVRSKQWWRGMSEETKPDVVSLQLRPELLCVFGTGNSKHSLDWCLLQTGHEVLYGSWWCLASGSSGTIRGTTSTWSLSKCTKMCLYEAQTYLCASISWMCTGEEPHSGAGRSARVNTGPHLKGKVNTRFDIIICYSTRYTHFWAWTNAQINK